MYCLMIPMKGKHESSDFLTHGPDGIQCLRASSRSRCEMVFDLSSVVKSYSSLNSSCVYTGRFTLTVVLCLDVAVDLTEGDTDAVCSEFDT